MPSDEALDAQIIFIDIIRSLLTTFMYNNAKGDKHEYYSLEKDFCLFFKIMPCYSVLLAASLFFFFVALSTLYVVGYHTRCWYIWQEPIFHNSACADAARLLELLIAVGVGAAGSNVHAAIQSQSNFCPRSSWTACVFISLWFSLKD